MDRAAESFSGFAFGRFLLFLHRRELLADGRPVKLGGRAFDVLAALVESPGAVISKDALRARVWPGRIVHENNLQWQIAALRAAFGADRELIRTVSGHGYQFTGEVRQLRAESTEDGDTAATPPASALPPTNIPEPVSELIGRDDELREILRLVAAHRLVTLTGTGGIGKTRLALAAARGLMARFADGIWIAELAPLADPGLVAGAVAAAVGVEVIAGGVSAEDVATALSGKGLLLVLDNCEHVIDAATMMAEALLRANPALRVIATSREPLRAEGEWIYPVPPLAVPAEHAEDEDNLQRYGAVQLFMDRAQAAEPHFAPDRRGIATICRRLDGIPLAIELAAARAGALGIEGLAARLDDRFGLLTGGRRTALPRHQTLRATFDWGYALLAEPERVVLRRLAVFAGAFGLRGASAVVASRDLAPSRVVDGLSSLVAKSLVTAEVAGAVTRYRLLNTTRAYALKKLGESGERERLAHRHAEHYRGVFERAEAEWETRSAAEWLADYGPRIDNLRTALDWAFGPEGDASIGIALTAAAVPLWMHLSLFGECRSRAEQALARLGNGAGRDAHREMKVQAALGSALTYIKGAAVPEVGEAWGRVLDTAEGMGDAEFQLRSLWGLWAFHLNAGRQRVALDLAQRFCTLAAGSSEPFDPLLGEQMLGVSEHHLGDQQKARQNLERALAGCVTSDHRHIVRFQIDLGVMARVFLARTLWLQGFPDQAMRAAHRSVADAQAIHHANSLGYALGLGACPVALMVGHADAANRYVRMLLDHSGRHGLPIWLAFGQSYRGSLIILRGDLATGLRLLRAGLVELGEGLSTSRFIASQIADALGREGRVTDGLAVIEEAIELSERGEERWATAELLRIKGKLVLLQGGSSAAAEAENLFRQALDWASQQGALSWELRTAKTLARLLRRQRRSPEAKALLQPVYDRFTEGFDTADLKSSKEILNVL